MGRSVNKVTLIGTLGKDPEVRYMPNGDAVANISLATDESYTNKETGQKVEATEWHRITVYGKLAEICQKYLKKGSRAYFEGKLKTREWEKDGVKRYTTEVVANDMMLLDRAEQQGAAQQFQPPAMQRQPTQAPAGYPQGQPLPYAQQPMQNQGYQQQNYQQAPMQQGNSFDDSEDIPF